MRGKIVEKINDKNGEPLMIYYSEIFANTPVVGLFLRTYSEIVDKGWAPPSITFGNTNRVVWASRENGSIAGGICFEYQDMPQLSWITLSFTDPSERGKGINGILHTHCENISKKLGATQLGSMVHINNINRLRSAEKAGFNPQYYRMYKNLE